MSQSSVKTAKHASRNLSKRARKKFLHKLKLGTWVVRLPLFILLSLYLFLLPLDISRQLEARDIVVRPPLMEFKISPYPQTTEPAPVVSAQSYAVLDGQSGVILASLRAKEQFHPASLTKLMTALVALDYYKFEDVLVVKRLTKIPEEAEMGLAIGDRLTVRNLLYGLLVPSGNDAAFALSDNYPGGIENFIYTMNKKSAVLHLKNTHFSNANGADGSGHLSSAADLLVIAQAAMENPEIAQIVATSGITLGDSAGRKSYAVRNVNQLLGIIPGLMGVKTGLTEEAGQCLITATTRGGHTIYTVVLKSSDRFGDSARLIEWAFRATVWQEIYPPWQTIPEQPGEHRP